MQMSSIIGNESMRSINMWHRANTSLPHLCLYLAARLLWAFFSMRCILDSLALTDILWTQVKHFCTCITIRVIWFFLNSIIRILTNLCKRLDHTCIMRHRWYLLLAQLKQWIIIIKILFGLWVLWIDFTSIILYNLSNVSVNAFSLSPCLGELIMHLLIHVICISCSYKLNLLPAWQNMIHI